MPPLRSIADHDALREGLASGVIDAICSDHQPHGLDAKLAPFSESAPGIAGLETLLSLTLRLVDEKVISLPDALGRITSQPARILGIDVGQLTPRAPADICIFDREAKWQCRAGEFTSQGTNSPFDRCYMVGQVDQALVDGKRIFKRIPSRAT
jgi:dihydroorotase